jgi:hypothetical protein
MLSLRSLLWQTELWKIPQSVPVQELLCLVLLDLIKALVRMLLSLLGLLCWLLEFCLVLFYTMEVSVKLMPPHEHLVVWRIGVGCSSQLSVMVPWGWRYLLRINRMMTTILSMLCEGFSLAWLPLITMPRSIRPLRSRMFPCIVLWRTWWPWVVECLVRRVCCTLWRRISSEVVSW